MATLKDLRLRGTKVLGDRDGHGEDDAFAVLCHVVGRQLEPEDADAVATGPQAAAFDSLIAECAGDPSPVEYHTGGSYFAGRLFRLARGCFVPFPELQLLSDAIVEQAEKGDRVLDLGCGVGPIGITAAIERPDLRISGVDIVPLHVEYARKNAETYGVDAEFDVSDLFSGITDRLFNVVACSLPFESTSTVSEFIDESDWKDQPMEAFVGGHGGWELFMRMMIEAPRVMVRDGMLMAYVDVDVAPDALVMFRGAGWYVQHVETDDAMAVVTVGRS